MRAHNKRSVVVRVPVLYGEVEENKESAVNILIDAVKEAQNAPKKFEHFAKRFPTNVDNVAGALAALSKWVKECTDKDIEHTIHYTSTQPFTKFEMACIFADILKLSKQNLVADTEEPTGAAAVSRPKDCQLSRRVFDNLGLSVDEGVQFVDFFSKYLTA